MRLAVPETGTTRTEVKLEGRGKASSYTCPPRCDNDSGGKQRALTKVQRREEALLAGF